mgnify:CR=1 FL=1
MWNRGKTSMRMNQRRFARSQISKYSAMKKAMQMSGWFTGSEIYLRHLPGCWLRVQHFSLRKNFFAKNPIRRPSVKQNHCATRMCFLVFFFFFFGFPVKRHEPAIEIFRAGTTKVRNVIISKRDSLDCSFKDNCFSVNRSFQIGMIVAHFRVAIPSKLCISFYRVHEV